MPSARVRGADRALSESHNVAWDDAPLNDGPLSMLNGHVARVMFEDGVQDRGEVVYSAYARAHSAHPIRRSVRPAP